MNGASCVWGLKEEILGVRRCTKPGSKPACDRRGERGAVDAFVQGFLLFCPLFPWRLLFPPYFHPISTSFLGGPGWESSIMWGCVEAFLGVGRCGRGKMHPGCERRGAKRAEHAVFSELIHFLTFYPSRLLFPPYFHPSSIPVPFSLGWES